jgi:clan AA aspartic protease
MEIETMGKVLVAAKIENVVDLYLANKGAIPQEEVRRVEVPEALVDTGATTLSMPGRMIRQLGLEPLRTRQARTTAGIATFNVFGTVRLTIQGRDCTLDVTEVPEDCPVLIGQVPLELLDFVVDPRKRQLVGNPEHGGEDMLEMY